MIWRSGSLEVQTNGNLEVQIYGFRDIYLSGNRGFLPEMVPYGLVRARIMTGKRYMAQEHFKTPPDPKKGNGITKNPQKCKKKKLELAKS